MRRRPCRPSRLPNPCRRPSTSLLARPSPRRRRPLPRRPTPLSSIASARAPSPAGDKLRGSAGFDVLSVIAEAPDVVAGFGLWAAARRGAASLGASRCGQPAERCGVPGRRSGHDSSPGNDTCALSSCGSRSSGALSGPSGGSTPSAPTCSSRDPAPRSESASGKPRARGRAGARDLGGFEAARGSAGQRPPPGRLAGWGAMVAAAAERRRGRRAGLPFSVMDL